MVIVKFSSSEKFADSEDGLHNFKGKVIRDHDASPLIKGTIIV